MIRTVRSMLNHLRKPLALVASVALIAVAAPVALHGGDAASTPTQSASAAAVAP